MRARYFTVVLTSVFFCGFQPSAPHALVPTPATVHPVAGSGVHYFTTALVHSSQPTATGMIQRSTETVDLSGDVSGRLLYQPISVFDFTAGTLVNTGHQVFSGMVLGVGPVMLHDDSFRFDVDLNTGATTGEVHLEATIAGRKARCDLQVVGTGMTSEGNATFNYSGACRVWPARTGAKD